MSLDDLYKAFASSSDDLLGPRGAQPCPLGNQETSRTVGANAPEGHHGHRQSEIQRSIPAAQAPTAEIDTLLAALVDASRNLPPAMERQLRECLHPLSRQDRAGLVAAVDDCFELEASDLIAHYEVEKLLNSHSFR